MAQHLIERACTRFRNEISQDDADEIISTASIDEVKLALRQIERTLAARQSSRDFDRLSPFLIAAERFSQVVEVVCNGTPYLPWIWAPVKFIIQSARDHAHVLDKLLMAYADIGNNMPRLSRYSEAFRDNRDFQRIIAFLFEDVLEFHRKAYTLLKKPGWSVFFSSAWGRFDHRFSSLLINIERLSELIDREAISLDIKETADLRRKDAEDASKREKERQVHQFETTMNWLGNGDRLQDDKLNMLAEKCYEGTYTWLHKSKKIRAWLGSKRGNSVLWLNGKPGSGKSTMSSKLVHFLKNDPNRRVCFFFCDYNTPSLDVGTQIQRTICAQIIRIAPDLVPYVFDEYLAKAQRPSSSVLKKVLEKVLPRFNDIQVVIDGIDELPPSEHSNLIKTLLQLPTFCPGLKLLLLSQDLSTISINLSKKPKLCLIEEAEAIGRDHAIMVEGTLQELNEKHHGAIGDAWMEKLKKDILDKSEGMFLWVTLVMTLLRGSINLQELQQDILLLPKTLAELYQKLLTNICNQYSPKSIANIRRIFAWLKCHKGRQPMLKCEVRLGMIMGEGTEKINRETRPWTNATDICKPLIEDGPGNTLVFIHSTVPQFLFDSGPGSFMSVPEAISSVTLACIYQLDQGLDLIQSSGSASTSTTDVACGFHGLLPYSYQYWTQHLLDFLSQSVEVATLSAIVIDGLKQLCQRLMKLSDIDEISLDTDEISRLLQKYLTVAESTVVVHIINQKKQTSLQESLVTPTVDAHFKSLREYNRIVRHIVRQPSIPDVEPQELIAFKEDYGSTAFVCDWPGCDYTLRGFASETQLSAHQVRHTQKLLCCEKDCSLNDVGFKTQSSLNAHKRKMHPEPGLEPIPKRFQDKIPPKMRDLSADQQQTRPGGLGEPSAISVSQGNPPPPPGLEMLSDRDLELALQNVTITSQEVQNARLASEKFKGWEDQEVRSYLVPLKQHQLRNRHRPPQP